MSRFRRGAGALLTMLTLSCSGTGEPVSPPAPPAAPAESEVDLSNTLRWTTASEVDNFGFDVYRGDGPDGPFERLTEKPVRGAGTTDVPQKYEFVDDSIEPGCEYWYYVESISIDGEREPFTPVVKVAAKGEAGGS